MISVLSGAYEAALPVIDESAEQPAPQRAQAVTEGLRIWTRRPYFRDHPGDAIARLSRLRSDASEYVRKSVGTRAGHQQEASGAGRGRAEDLEPGNQEGFAGLSPGFHTHFMRHS